MGVSARRAEDRPQLQHRPDQGTKQEQIAGGYVVWITYFL